MPNFKYEAVIKGTPEKSTINASDIKEAASMLRQRGGIILNLSEIAEKTEDNTALEGDNKDLSAYNISLSSLFVSSKALEQILRYLSVLIKGGVPILSALEISSEQAEGKLAKSLIKVAEGIRGGHTLTESMEKDMAFLGRLTLGLVHVGESNGSLDIMFQYAASLLERKRKIRNDLIQAMVYPAIVTVMSLSAGFYITVVAIPKITSLLGQNPNALPPITRLLIDSSAFIRNYWPALVAFPILVIIGIIFARKKKVVGEKIDQYMLKVPLFGKIFRASLNALWGRNLGILIRSGIDIVSALHLTEKGLLNLHYKKEFVRIIEKVKSGIPFSDAIKVTTIKKLTPLAYSMVKIGENTGTIDDGLLYVSSFNEEELERKLEFLSKIIEPVLLVVVGGMVAFVYLAFFIGLMSITRRAGM
jgi:type IV pilus assembly protein PilC